MAVKRSLSVVALASLSGLANAISIPFNAVQAPSSSNVRFPSLASSKDVDDFDFNNINDIVNSDIYVATINVNGQDFVVRLILV